MEIPYPEHNSRNSVRELTVTKLKCYTTLIRTETLIPQKEVSHQKLSQASPFMSYIQLVGERLSEEVNATIPKGIMDDFEFTVLQRNLKERHEGPKNYVCEC